MIFIPNFSKIFIINLMMAINLLAVSSIHVLHNLISKLFPVFSLSIFQKFCTIQG